jgi:hypothetical protein
MNKLVITYPPGATPLDSNELEGLIPDYITTREELNELEQKNIQQAILWVQKRRSIEPLMIEPTYD